MFADDDARRKLERITHPRIATATLVRSRELESENEPLACYEATLLVEGGRADQFRPLVVVAADEHTQLERAVRRGLPEMEARARMRAQLPMSAKIAAADYVITNDGDLAQLDAETDRVLRSICLASGVAPSRYGLD